MEKYSFFSLCTEIIKGVYLNFYKGSLYEGDTADLPAKMPLRQCTEHGQQTHGAGFHCSAGKLGSNWHQCNVVGGIKGLVT